MPLRFRWIVPAACIAWTGVSAQNTPLAPFRAGDRYFFTADSGTLYVRDDESAPARALLPAHSYGIVAPSRNGQYIAYTLPAPANATSYQVHIRDVGTRRDLSDVLDHAVITGAPWTDNHKGFFYAREDATGRQRVYYHRVGQTQLRDEAIYSNPDTTWHYFVRVSDDGHYAVFTITHPQDDHTRIYFIDLENPGRPSLNAPVVKLVDAFTARYEFIDNGGSTFFLTTNRAAPLGRVVMANTDVTREERWPPVIRETNDTLREVHTAGDEYIIAVYRNGDRAFVRLFTPPSADEMRNEARRRLDSVRKANGDTTDDGDRLPRPRAIPGTPAQDGVIYPRGSVEISGFRLDATGTIPVPSGATVIAMNSIADQDDLYYTVKLPDGTTQFYTFNVKRRTNTPFNTSTTPPSKR
jgi:hypothetical protein